VPTLIYIGTKFVVPLRVLVLRSTVYDYFPKGINIFPTRIEPFVAFLAVHTLV
jgi:hypothetical protein